MQVSEAVLSPFSGLKENELNDLGSQTAAHYVTDGISAVRLLPQSRRPRPSSRALFTVVTLLLLGLLVTSLCRNGFKKHTEAGVTRRGLGESPREDSEDVDEELEQILEQCIDMEEESGLLHQHFLSSVPDSSDPAAMKARMVEQMRAVASAFQLPSYSTTESNQGVSTWEDNTQKEVPHTYPQSWGYVSGGYTLPIPVRQPSGTSLPIVSPGETSAVMPSVGLEASAGETLEIEGESEATEDESAQLLTSLLPDAWMDQIPGLISGGNETETAGERAEVLPSGREEGESSSARRRSNMHHILGLHPFVRLPVVPPSAVCRELRLVRIATINQLKGSPVKMLLVVRDLFAKPVLDKDDVELLMVTVEMLVRYATVKLQPQAWRDNAAEIARQAGILFMILDAVISACQILGPKTKVERWWKTFVEGFHTDIFFKKQSIEFLTNVSYNHMLARRLLAAIDVYKTGTRPGFHEIIILKRMLLCSPFSPAYFKGSRWDAWRFDDERFRASQREPFDPLDEETEN